MNCNVTILGSYKIVGISVRTTNENGRAAIDIGQLWQRFYSEDIPSRIANKIDNNIYSVYTDYEQDYRSAYTNIIGFRVSHLEEIPAEVEGWEFEGGNYCVFKAQGKMPDALLRKWQEIWDRDKELHRKYSSDFEVYRPEPLRTEDAVVDIYLSIK